MTTTYQSCFPNGGLPTCPVGGTFFPAPTLAFPNQDLVKMAALSAEVAPGNLGHGQPVTINHGTYYHFFGSAFLHLSDQDFIGYSTHPRFPLSGLFQWAFLKYPAVSPADVRPDGSVPYASPGLTIREGDFVMLQNLAAGEITAQNGPPVPHNLPNVNTPLRVAINDFANVGSFSPETMRIIGEDFDDSIPSVQQPPVRTDGSKAYFLQFMRTKQNLALYPNQSPAPCFVKTSAFKGDGTRWIMLPIESFFNLPVPIEQPRALPAPVPAALVATVPVPVTNAFVPGVNTAVPAAVPVAVAVPAAGAAVPVNFVAPAPNAVIGQAQRTSALTPVAK